MTLRCSACLVNGVDVVAAVVIVFVNFVIIIIITIIIRLCHFFNRAC